MSNTVTATAYLIIKGKRPTYGYDSKDPVTGLRPVNEASVGASRQNRPDKLNKDEVLIKVKVQLPVKAFDPIAPSALIIVPEDMILDRGEFEATVLDEGEQA